MSLKRKRETTDDNNDLGSPKKRQKSIDTSSPSSEYNISSQNNCNTPSAPSNINESDLAMDGDDENSDIDNNEFQDTNTAKKTTECPLKDSIHEKKEEDSDNTTNQLITTPIKCNTLSIKQSLCPSTDASSNNASPVITHKQRNTVLPLQRRDINRGSNKVKTSKQRRKMLKNNGFWTEIDKLDLIVPSPADDLCDRHLIIIHTYPKDEEKHTESDDENGEKVFSSDLHGLDSDDTSDIEYKLLPNTSLSESLLDLLKSMSSKQYRIVKIANYALSIKSEYFRNLLSRNSSFAECSSQFIVIRVSVYDGFGVELLLRLLHVNQHDIDQYLQRVENHETLIQLLLLCDQYQVKHLSNAILKRLKFISSRKRLKPLRESGIQRMNKGDNDSDKENGDNTTQKRRKRRRRSFWNKTKEKKKKKQFIRHILPLFNPSFDNGGMTLQQISSLLLIADNFECLNSIKEIGVDALRARYKWFSFDKCGIVDIKFRKLPFVAVNALLSDNSFCSWSENDVFLACTQWAAFPLHINDSDIIYTMSPDDNKQEIVETRFEQISQNIRFHLLNRWFVDVIVKHYKPIQTNKNLLLEVLTTSTKASLIAPQSPRNEDVNKYFSKQKLQNRTIPPKVILNNDDNVNNNNTIYFNNERNNNAINWQSLIYRNLSVEEIYRKQREYDTFIVVYNRKDLVLLSIGDRLTSPFMVWNGIVFALDLVRKENILLNENNGDSVGVFLYSQGLECSDHLWIKYSLRTLDHEHLLQCSDYKMMNLNFQKGNGSRDFFGCDWHSFLNTYFDNNNQIKFKLTFIDAK